MATFDRAANSLLCAAMRRFAQAIPARVGVRRLAPPASLATLLAIILIVGLAWALLVPPWQAPDEISHFSYAQSIAENFALPGNTRRPGKSSDQSLADDTVGATRGAFYPRTAPPNWSGSDYSSYLTRVRSVHPPPKSDGGGLDSAQSNPPLYYLFADVGYLIDSGGTAFGQLYTIRISGVLLLGVTTIAGWLLAGETLGRRRLPQLACASVAGLLPMTTFMSTSVNPDALLYALWTLALWLGARVINHRVRRWDAVALCTVTAAAILTKATSYALVPAVVMALFIGWLRRPRSERKRDLSFIAAAGMVLLLPVVGWLELAHSLRRAGINGVAVSAAHPVNIRQFLSYVWQFYLPRLPFLRPFRTTSGLPVYDIWLRQGLGTFGWLVVYLPGWLYTAAAAALGSIAIVSVGLLTRLRDRRHLALLGFFGLALFALVVLLHATEYVLIIDGAGQFNQGRYLLPVVGLLGLAVGLIVREIPAPAQPPACGLVLTALLTVQVISLSAVIQAYYL